MCDDVYYYKDRVRELESINSFVKSNTLLSVQNRIEYVRDDGLYCKTYQKVINTLNVSTIDIFYYGKRGPNYLATSEFIVNITNLFELFNSCITHIRYDMQEAQQIEQANAEQIIKEINTIIENIINICNNNKYKYNLLEVITLGEYIRNNS